MKVSRIFTKSTREGCRQTALGSLQKEVRIAPYSGTVCFWAESGPAALEFPVAKTDVGDSMGFRGSIDILRIASSILLTVTGYQSSFHVNL